MYSRVLEALENSIPPEMSWEKPVTFLDPFNRCFPIQLQCIDSLEVLLALLAAKFPRSGRTKLNRGEFHLRDMDTGRPINPYNPWKLCLYPGQKVEMRMVFEYLGASTFRQCLFCEGEVQGAAGSDIEWCVSDINLDHATDCVLV